MYHVYEHGVGPCKLRGARVVAAVPPCSTCNVQFAQSVVRSLLDLREMSQSVSCLGISFVNSKYYAVLDTKIHFVSY